MLSPIVVWSEAQEIFCDGKTQRQDDALE